MMFQKICIYGAGAIGGWIGARLAQQPGVTLSVVARGETLAALKSSGLRLHMSGALITHSALTTSSNSADLGVQDLVIVAVKAPSLANVAAHIAPLLGPNTVVLTAMNGVPWWFLQGFGGSHANTPLSSVDRQDRIAQAIPAEHVIGCVVHASCSLRSPAEVQHHFGNGLIIGEPSGLVSERVQALHALLQNAGFDTTLSAQIQKDTWYKLWGNMTINPVSALTGATTDKILNDPLVLNFISQVMLEAKSIGAAIGIPIDQHPEDRHAVTRKLGAFKSSMLQDVEAKRAVELDALVGAVRELGQITGVATPFTDALFGLSRLQMQGLGLYPTA
ncbi:MAG: 2-dehydropantoate 2-reductase [Polaromonas sp.]|nr:2-dehydropantoate 2-reductase [Polaromonas sp.]